MDNWIPTGIGFIRSTAVIGVHIAATALGDPDGTVTYTILLELIDGKTNYYRRRFNTEEEARDTVQALFNTPNWPMESAVHND